MKDEILQQSIKIINDEIQHLNEFVKECLGFVRPLTTHHFDEIAINEVLNIVKDGVSHMFEELSEKIKITTDMDPKLPLVQANYEEIKQAFLNILRNNYEAMEKGGELLIKTCFKSDPPPGYVEINISDNGVGIKKENMKRIFRPFFTTKVKGTGLGLAICRRIIEERHHGKISILSEDGKGTTVRVELPIHQTLSTSGGKTE
jgi:signal transduction histidine kinase